MIDITSTVNNFFSNAINSLNQTLASSFPGVILSINPAKTLGGIKITGMEILSNCVGLYTNLHRLSESEYFWFVL